MATTTVIMSCLPVALLATGVAMGQDIRDSAAALKAYFDTPPDGRQPLAQPWRQATGLSAPEAAAWRDAIWKAYLAADGPIQQAWREDLAQRRVTLGPTVMRYTLQTTGERPPTGWPLLISLRSQGDVKTHDKPGSSQPSQPQFDGMYLCPQAPGDDPTQWDTPECYDLLDLLVRQFVAFGGVDRNRVYLHGHAAGGEGVLRLGPNLADRWAATAVADAIIPAERTPIENLLNTPLHLEVWQRGTESETVRLAQVWVRTLQGLRDDANPQEYICELVAHEGRTPEIDDSGLAWLSQFTRNPAPKRIAWTQSGLVQNNRYWLRLDDPYGGQRPDNWYNRPETIDARLGGQLVSLAMKGLAKVTIRLDDRLLDLDRPLTVTVNDEEAFTGRLMRSAATLVRTLEERGDPELMYCAELALNVPPPLGARGEPAVADAAVRGAYPTPGDPALAAAVEAALQKAGANRRELARALADIGDEYRPGLFFLIANMPERDLVRLKADFLSENVKLAYQAWRNAPWAAQVSEPQFFQYILPFAHFNERRDNWRRDFYERFHAEVWTFKDPIDAVRWLNATLNDTVNVHYHAWKRPKSDQSPYESIAASYASCTGLSVLLADACRAVGIPARLVGVARWAKTGGNHTWVEVWGGPAEPTDGVAIRRWYNVGDTGSDPRKGDWVNERCREQTDAGKPLHSVHAACFRRAALHFPLAWDLELDYVPALNVTRFYTDPVEVELALPAGRHDVAVYWADEVLLTAAGDGSMRLPLARGEPFRVVITAPDGTREERRLEP